MDPHDRPFDQLARSESPTSSPSLHAILSSPASRLAHARALICLPHPQAQSEAEDPTHPLAVFLFLLDCLSFLGGEGTSGGRRGVGRGRMVKNEGRVDGDKVTIHGGKGGKEDDMGISEGRREDKEVLLGPGIDDQRRSASKGCAGEVEQGEQRRGKGVEANDGWSDWIEYVREMYLYPTEGNSSWISPLSLSSQSIPSLATLCTRSTFDTTTHDLLLASVDEAVDLSSFGSKVKFELSSYLSLSPPLSPSLLSSLASTLADKRMLASGTSEPVTSSTLTYRSVLTVVMEQHLGTQFGKHSQEEGSARRMDEEGIRAYYGGARARLASGSASVEGDRKKDKLRGIFGGKSSLDRALCAGADACGIFTASVKRPPVLALDRATHTRSASNSIPNTLRPSSFVYHSKGSSYDSKPLLPRPASTQQFTSRATEHRRVYSTGSSGTTTSTAPSSPSCSTTSREPLVPIQPLMITPDHVPFGNLAPIDVPFSTLPLLESSTEGYELEAPLDRNTLTPEERRDQLKRSRKLNQLLGHPSDVEPSRPSTDIQRTTSQSKRLSSLGSKSGGKVLYKATSPVRDRFRRQSLSLPSPPIFPSHSYSNSVSMASSSSMARSTSSPLPTPSLDPRSGYHDPTLSPDPELGSFPPSSSIHSRASFAALGGTKEQVREERRKKLKKLERLLGERVPIALALNERPGRRESQTSMGSGKMGGLGGILKGAGEKLGLTGRSSAEELRAGKEYQDEIEERRRDDERGPRSPRIQIDDVGLVKGLEKARKLEQVFGEVPPTSLYLAPSRPDLRQRTHSNNPATSIYSYYPASPAHSSGTSSIQSYRTSIASLTYLVERDPDSADDIASFYGRDEEDQHSIKGRMSSVPQGLGDGASGRPQFDQYSLYAAGSPLPSPLPFPLTAIESPISPESPGLAPAETLVLTDSDTEFQTQLSAQIQRMRASTISALDSAYSPVTASPASMIEEESVREEPKEGLESTGESSKAGQRTVKRAQKLASFFGTTRGEVWGTLLDDLEAAIVEEEDIDEEERIEVLNGVERLRLSNSGSRG